MNSTEPCFPCQLLPPFSLLSSRSHTPKSVVWLCELKATISMGDSASISRLTLSPLGLAAAHPRLAAVSGCRVVMPERSIARRLSMMEASVLLSAATCAMWSRDELRRWDDDDTEQAEEARDNGAAAWGSWLLGVNT